MSNLDKAGDAAEFLATVVQPPAQLHPDASEFEQFLGYVAQDPMVTIAVIHPDKETGSKTSPALNQ